MTIGVLFVCTGNICRSPTAEGVFRTLVEREGLGDRITVDSAGTYHGHIGSAPSPPAVEAAARRGYDISGLVARLLSPGDVERFDYPIAMDRSHLATLRRIAPVALLDRPRMLLEFAPELGLRDVADPYMRGPADYERALDLIEAGCTGLLAEIRKTLP
jgi:protein-tyrosine phosphatase